MGGGGTIGGDTEAPVEPGPLASGLGYSRVSQRRGLRLPWKAARTTTRLSCSTNRTWLGKPARERPSYRPVDAGPLPGIAHDGLHHGIHDPGNLRFGEGDGR